MERAAVFVFRKCHHTMDYSQHCRIAVLVFITTALLACMLSSTYRHWYAHGTMHLSGHGSQQCHSFTTIDMKTAVRCQAILTCVMYVHILLLYNVPSYTGNTIVTACDTNVHNIIIIAHIYGHNIHAHTEAGTSK